jgi:hypothetical protein
MAKLNRTIDNLIRTTRVPLWTLLTLGMLLPGSLWAQRHPMYLHARSDLRRATILMRLPDEPNVMRDMQVAVDYTERAIREIDAAAMWDRRDIDEHPPVDTRMGRGGRFREVLRLLDAARGDIGREEDNPAAAVWRNRAYRNIDDAMALVRRGGYDKFRDEMGGAPPMPPPDRPVQPRYVHAISDLRTARAFLWREDWREVMRDQRAAVDAIDRAIAAARAASIDDGSNPNVAAPIDRRVGWGDRFTKAMELLESAYRDLSYAEDNNMRSAEWRTNALNNVQQAKDFVARAQRAAYWR